MSLMLEAGLPPSARHLASGVLSRSGSACILGAERRPAFLVSLWF